MRYALFIIGCFVGSFSAIQFGVFLGGGTLLINPFVALLGMIATPFIFGMCIASWLAYHDSLL